MTDHQPLVAVGRIVKVFGLRGEVVVKPLTSSPERFAQLAVVLVGPAEPDARPRTIASVRIGARGVRLGFTDVTDRTAAEALRGHFLYVAAKERITPPPGAYFVEDVVGLRVVDERDGEVGRVKDVLRMPAHDVYVIGTGAEDILLPAVKEFVREIDVERGEMRVRLLDGMRGGG